MSSYLWLCGGAYLLGMAVLVIAVLVRGKKGDPQQKIREGEE